MSSEEYLLDDESEDGVDADVSYSVASLREQLEAEKERARGYLASWQRTQADLENFRKRVQQERGESLDLANSTLVSKLLNAMDDLELAFSRPSSEMRKELEWILKGSTQD